MTIQPCFTAIPSPPKSTTGGDSAIPSSNLYATSTGPSEITVYKTLRWPNGSTVKVFLMDDFPCSETVKLAVEGNAKIWHDYANIRFQFVQDLPADIRVSFDPSKGFWSYIGTWREDILPSAATMNLAFNDTTDRSTLRGTTLHEFGHAIGCLHEHQSPDVKIQWDEKIVIRDCKMLHGWDEKKTRDQILNKYDIMDENVWHPLYDQHSIMHYPFDANWTLNNTSTPWNTELSDQDQVLISEMYPQQQQKSYRFMTKFDSNKPILQNPKEMLLGNMGKFASPPRILLGITNLDIGAGNNIRIKAAAGKVVNKKFVIHLDSWADTKLKAAGCIWFKSPSDSVFQVGSFNTMDCRPWSKPATTTNKRIKFPTRFTTKPIILIWLNWIDCDRRYSASLKAYAKDIDVEGFTICIDSISDTVLYSGGASWIAYPADMADVCSGTIERHRGNPSERFEYFGSVPFDENLFMTPEPYLAISWIDFAPGQDVNFNLTIDSVDRGQFKWRMNSAIDSMCRGLGATYLLI